jgi:SAM-dependent methyltransferase
MKNYSSTTTGDRQPNYDELDWAIAYDEDEAVDFLLPLASGGAALELGVGTGRVAIPLAKRGVAVVGIEASEVMADQLKRKDGAGTIEIMIGDFSDIATQRDFALVYSVFNTFFLLLTQNKQVKCFSNVAERLAPGGSFVLQTYVPDLRQLANGQHTETIQVGVDHAVIFASRYNLVSQRVQRQQMVVTETGTTMYPMAFRHVWPSELDLMARIAGLKLAERWGGWRHEPFTGEGTFVSVYRKVGRGQ